LFFLLRANQCVAPKSVGGESNLFILPGPSCLATNPTLAASQPLRALHVNYGRGNDGNSGACARMVGVRD